MRKNYLTNLSKKKNKPEPVEFFQVGPRSYWEAVGVFTKEQLDRAEKHEMGFIANYWVLSCFLSITLKAAYKKPCAKIKK